MKALVLSILLVTTFGAFAGVEESGKQGGEDGLVIIDKPEEPILYQHEEQVCGLLGAPGFGKRRAFLFFPGHTTVDGFGIGWKDDLGSYQTVIADLVGILVAAKPRVYAFSQSRAMARLNEEGPHLLPLTKLPLPEITLDEGLPVRGLDDFESRALALLKEGHALIYREANGVIRAFGAIRMQKGCRACHETEKDGALLGAITYTGIMTNRASDEDKRQREHLRQEAATDIKNEALLLKYVRYYKEVRNMPDETKAAWLDSALALEGVITPQMLVRQRALRAKLPIKDTDLEEVLKVMGRPQEQRIARPSRP